MKRRSTKKDELDIPELTREQLANGVRGKYYERVHRGSNVVILDPENARVFPTSEAVNEALATLLSISRDALRITRARPRAKRRTA